MQFFSKFMVTTKLMMRPGMMYKYILQSKFSIQYKLILAECSSREFVGCSDTMDKAHGRERNEFPPFSF